MNKRINSTLCLFFFTISRKVRNEREYMGLILSDCFVYDMWPKNIIEVASLECALLIVIIIFTKVMLYIFIIIKTIIIKMNICAIYIGNHLYNHYHPFMLGNASFLSKEKPYRVNVVILDDDDDDDGRGQSTPTTITHKSKWRHTKCI